VNRARLAQGFESPTHIPNLKGMKRRIDLLAYTLKSTYLCSCCAKMYNVIRDISPKVLPTVTESLRSARLCKACHNEMHLIHVKCQTIPNIYGGEGGFWQCAEDHHNARFYHLPLENTAYRLRKNKIHSNYRSWIPYERIITQGFPWKCPICKNVMNYCLEKDTPKHRIGSII